MLENSKWVKGWSPREVDRYNTRGKPGVSKRLLVIVEIVLSSQYVSGSLQSELMCPCHGSLVLVGFRKLN